MTRARVAALLLTMAGLGSAAVCGAQMLPDSTQLDGWTLGNGLEVRVRHVPGAHGVAVVLAFRAGKLYEPEGREGLAELLAELEYTAPAGDVPSRSRDEMESLRPLGWGLRTGTHLTTLTELASREQFPGVLRQAATRLRGVTVSSEALDAARAQVKKDLGSSTFGQPDVGLANRVRDLALGISDEELLRRATGKVLDGLTAQAIAAKLDSLYVPANAVLAIAGDLSGIRVRELVEQEFGSIPAGVRQPERPEPVLKAGSRVATWPGLAGPCGVVGLFAPALDDSVHPAFFLGVLTIGSWFRANMGPPTAPLTTRFQYSILDEPDLARIYPDPDKQSPSPAAMVKLINLGMDMVGGQPMSLDLIDQVRSSVDWLLGGPLPPSVRDRMRTRAASLGTLASGMATRALWRGDGFWNDYRRHFETTRLGHNMFTGWLADPAHQAALMFTPTR